MSSTWSKSVAAVCGIASSSAVIAAGLAAARAAGDDGAGWPYGALARPTPPAAPSGDTWSRGAIDRFVLARLRAVGLAPNPEASRRTLVRRVTFDLTGLPPTPEEVEAFLRDDAPGAYERLVDRLLASPRFGERWASHWLDVARFAESHGFEHDYDRPYAYHYRDFVIDAFNQDMPYDRFVRWQIAGDEEAPDTPLALMATGFLGAGVFPTQITANEVERTRYDALDDMASTLGTAFLGTTVGCARCHDHEYDPITMRDYYGLIAHFATTVRSNVDVDLDPEGHARDLADWERAHAPLAAELARYEREELPHELDAFLSSPPAWVGDDPDEYAALTWGGWRSAGPFTAEHGDVAFDTDFGPEAGDEAQGAEAVVWTDQPTFVDGAGHELHGEHAATYLERKVVAPRARKTRLALGSDDAIRAWVNGALVHDKRVARGLTVGQDEVEVELRAGENRVLLKIVNYTGGYGFSFAALGEETAQGVPLSVARLLATPRTAHTAEDREALLGWYRARDPGWSMRDGAVREHLARKPAPKVVKVQVCSEGVTPMRHHTQGADFFETTYFLERGDTGLKRDPVEPSFPAVLVRGGATPDRWRTPAPEGARTSFRRTSLARWLTDVEHGAGNLLARVIVNRLWQHHLGRGIVATPSDFGSEGEPATHPELLEWLACELVRRDWSLKAIHRLILTSATYRQDGTYDPDRAGLDPENALLWRRAPTRLEAESIRDAILAVSGLLDATMHGPGSLDADQTRRSVYLTVKRSKLVPALQIFDAPDKLQGQAERGETIVAPQALYLMNAPFVRRCAGGFAARLGDVSDEEAVERAYRLALARAPAAAERDEALAFLAAQTESYVQRGLADAGALARADFCQLLFGLNEFVYVP